MPTTADVWQAALAYEGAPWRHQGRSRAGLDCLGLIIAVAVDLGLEGAERHLGVESRRYRMLPPNRLAAELLARGMTRAAGPDIGRVGLFAQPGTYPIHVGIFGDGELIHAFAKAGKVVRHGYVAPWPGNLRGVFAYPGVEYAA